MTQNARLGGFVLNCINKSVRKLRGTVCSRIRRRKEPCIMKKFIVDSRVFDVLPNYCLGVVAAFGIDNRGASQKTESLLDEQIKIFAEKYKSANVRELPTIKACRDAFAVLGMNPNKFMCSIEALTKRVQKTAKLPHINAIVDLGNAFSLKYLLPMGAHDIRKLEGDLEVRFSSKADHFLEMGADAPEAMPDGELVYVSGHTVKTRRWIWRQSDDGKITEETTDAFFPIDSFENVGVEAALKARDELALFLRDEFHCEVKTGFVNRENNSFSCDPA